MLQYANDNSPGETKTKQIAYNIQIKWPCLHENWWDSNKSDFIIFK